MPMFITTQLFSLLAGPAIAAAYPMPALQSPENGEKSSANSEAIAIDEDRANRMTVPVSIEGTGPYKFVIDTGSQRTVLSKKLATGLSLPVEPPAMLMSVAGETKVDMVFVPELTLGKRRYNGLVTPVLRKSDLGADGILGLDSLQDQRILFDFESNQIVVEDSVRARQKRNFREITVTARQKEGQLIFTDARIAGMRVNVVVDTGSEISIGNLALKRKLLQRARENEKDNLLIAVTGDTIDVDIAHVRDFRLHRAVIPQLPMVFADAPPFKLLGLDDRPALLLGMDVLRQFDQFAIDFRFRKLYFTLPRKTPRHFDDNHRVNIISR